MTAASQLLWRASGRPRPNKPVVEASGRCAVCGDYIYRHGVSVKNAIGTTFASHGELACQFSDYVCCACTWVLGGKPPDSIRLWSIVVRGDIDAPPNTSPKAPDTKRHVHLTSRADLRWPMDTLLTPPDCEWMVTVATSGQKHIIPFAQVNRGEPWVVRLESVNVPGDPVRLAVLLYVAGQLMEHGLYGSEILSGEPSFKRLIKLGLDAWRQAEEHLQPERGGPLLELAVIALNKEHHHVITERARAELVGRGFDTARCHLHPGNIAVSGPGDNRSEEVVGASKDGTGDISKRSRALVPDGEPVRKEASDRSSYSSHYQGDLFGPGEAD